MFKYANGINTVIEFGANVGQNLIALKQLLPSSNFSAVEINGKACEELRKLKWLNVYNESILAFSPTKTYDFVFIKGVLIHINPEELIVTYEKLYKSTKKYLLVAEYYNPTPIEVNYRGHTNRLFKRDFAGEILNKYEDLELVDYGFTYHRDNNFPQDDINWFLLKKTEVNL